MIQQQTTVTLDQFHAFLRQPENRGRHFEFMHGRMVEKMVASPYSSRVSVRIAARIDAYLSDNDIGFLTGMDGGYIVGDERFIPDCAFISYARMPELVTEEGYIALAPDIAVEVMSPTDSMRGLLDKVADYLAAGTVVVVAFPETHEIAVYAPGMPARKLKAGDTLTLAALPGFAVAVTDCFPRESGKQTAGD
jgi:Uma2 family endonuclease